MPQRLPEPWLRGPLPGVPPVAMPVFHSFRQVREDLARHVAGLDAERVWQVVGRSSLGFHLKHLAGSVDRLTTYLIGGQLSAEQLAFLRTESEPVGDSSELLGRIEAALTKAEGELLQVPADTLFEVRTVGRQQLPSTVLGLLVHLCEHTQRHLGQAITLAGLVR